MSKDYTLVITTEAPLSCDLDTNFQLMEHALDRVETPTLTLHLNKITRTFKEWLVLQQELTLGILINKTESLLSASSKKKLTTNPIRLLFAGILQDGSLSQLPLISIQANHDLLSMPITKVELITYEYPSSKVSLNTTSLLYISKDV